MEFMAGWKSLLPVSSTFSAPLFMPNKDPEAPIGPLVFTPQPDSLTTLLYSPSLSPRLPPPYPQLTLSRFLNSIPSSASSISSLLGPQLSDWSSEFHGLTCLQLLQVPHKNLIVVFFPTGENSDCVGYSLLSIKDGILGAHTQRENKIHVVKEGNVNHQRITCLLVNPVDDCCNENGDEKFGDASNIQKCNDIETIVGFLMVCTNYSVYWYRVGLSTIHKQNENSVRLDYVGCATTKMLRGNPVGCDGSILLDGPQVEKRACQNLGLGGFMLIDKIKKVLEIRCPRTVTCADILNLAVRDAVNLAGAPSYPVLLGRRDGLESNVRWVDLPTRSITVEDGLAYFRSKGLDSQDYATLLGSHTLGKTHCAYIRDRLYNFQKTGKPDPSVKWATLERLRQTCLEEPDKSKKEQTVFLTEPNGDRYRFTNKYYGNVLAHDTVLRVDEELMFNGNTSQIVLDYAGRFDLFKKEFALSVSRMGSLKVLTGEQGEIRLNCRYTNKNNPYIN